MASEMLLYEKVYHDLKSKILSGFYPDGALLPSEREIGEEHAVDRTTVRKALKLLVDDSLVVKLPGIGTKVTKNGIPSGNGKILKLEQNKTIGFFLPPSIHRRDRISQPFYASLFYHIEKESKLNGYSCYYSTLDEEDDFEQVLARQQFAGIVFVTNVADTFIQSARSKGIPCVLVNEYNPSIPSYLADNINGMIQACDYLISLGHWKFALVTGIPSYLSCRERLIGCFSSLMKHDREKPYIVSCDWEPETAYRVTKELLVSVAELPTAIVAFNDNIAFGCFLAASELHLRIPQDISVVGFDDIEQSRYSIPALTTVHGNVETLAKSALQGLFHQMHEKHPPIAVRSYVPCSLVIRESASSPPQEKPKITLREDAQAKGVSHADH